MGSGHGGRNQAGMTVFHHVDNLVASMGSGHGGRNQGSRKNGPVTWDYTGLRERWWQRTAMRRQRRGEMVARRALTWVRALPRV